MKKSMFIIVLFMMVMVLSQSVFAVVDPGYNANLVDNEIKNKSLNVWATVVTVVRIAAVGCVVFAGLRYMYAAPEAKADIKQGLAYLTIGAILVFCATLIITFVTNSAGQIVGNTPAQQVQPGQNGGGVNNTPNVVPGDRNIVENMLN